MSGGAGLPWASDRSRPSLLDVSFRGFLPESLALILAAHRPLLIRPGHPLPATAFQQPCALAGELTTTLGSEQEREGQAPKGPGLGAVGRAAHSARCVALAPTRAGVAARCSLPRGPSNSIFSCPTPLCSQAGWHPRSCWGKVQSPNEYLTRLINQSA